MILRVVLWGLGGLGSSEQLNIGASLDLAMVPIWVGCVMHDGGTF